MTRYRVVWALFLIALIAALGTGRGLLWAAAGTLLAMILIAVGWAWLGVNWLRISRRTFSRTAQVGQVLEEEFKLANLSRLPKLWVEVHDLSTLPGHTASRAVGLLGGHQWRGWRVRTTCTQRGRYALGPVIVSSGDPLGIYQLQRRVGTMHTLLVHPLTFELTRFPLPAALLTGGEALHRRTHHVTPNAAGLRDYVAGDSINRIHWPSSARRQRLTVKEFELDPASDIWIALDLWSGGHIAREDFEMGGASTAPERLLPASTEEYAVAIAASIAQHFVRQGRSVGLIAHEAHRLVIPAECGERQLNKIMEALAVAHAVGAIPFDGLLNMEASLLQRRASLVAISAWPEGAWAVAVERLTHSGIRVAAIVIDSQSFGAAHHSEALIAALANAGAIVRVVRYGQSIPLAIEGEPARIQQRSQAAAL
jgi:uncharacterized protein (DUF58 family)